MSDSLWPHGLQHARPPCPSPTPGVYLNSCPLSQWCHPTISSSVIPFSSCPQSFPASGSFPMSQLFASGGQSIGVSPSASVLLMNIQDWSSLGWTGWISLLSHVQFFGTPLTVAFQAPLSMEFSRQEYWSGLPFPSPGDQTQVFSIAGRFFFTIWAIREAPSSTYSPLIWAYFRN